VSAGSPIPEVERSEATLRRLPQDPGLPRLRDLFPERGAPDFVAEFARAGGVEPVPEQGEVEYVRYRPGRSCVVLWSLPTRSGGRLHLYAKLVARDRAARDRQGAVARPGFRELAAKAEALRAPGWRAYHHLPERNLLLAASPFDPRLRGLPLALSAAWIRERIAPLLGEENGKEEGRGLGATPLSYKPERRCVVRYDRPDGALGFAKLFRDERGAALLPWLRAVATQLGSRAAPWTIVSPRAHLSEARLLLLPAVPGGTGFGQWLKPVATGGAGGDAGALLAQVERAGRGLAAFQRCQLGGLPVVTPGELVSGLRASATSVCSVAPELGKAVDERLSRLDRAAARLAPEPLVPTHGAFRHGQLLLLPETLVVLDLDTLCRSGASADAGNFLAYLDFLAVRRPRLGALVARSRQAFAGALGETSGWLSWYRAASHLKVALRSFLSLTLEWPAHTEGMLAWADRALAELDAPGGSPC
jgi:hypothetical protein